MKRIFSEIIGQIQNFLRATSHRMSCSKYSKTVLFCRELTQQAMKLYPRTRTISGAVLDPCGPGIGHPQSRGAEQVNLIRILKTTHVVGRARGLPRPYGRQELAPRLAVRIRCLQRDGGGGNQCPALSARPPNPAPMGEPRHWTMRLDCASMDAGLPRSPAWCTK